MVRVQTRLEQMYLVIKDLDKRLLRWLGHVLLNKDDRLSQQATYWQIDHTNVRIICKYCVNVVLCVVDRFWRHWVANR